MAWQIGVIGDSMDVAEVHTLAPTCGCAIVTSPDGGPCLAGERFDTLDDHKEVRRVAREMLMVLNCMALLRYPDHRPVQLGSTTARVRPDGGRDIIVSAAGLAEGRGRASADATVVLAVGTTGSPNRVDRNAERYRRISTDPTLRSVMEALIGNPSWQRLRVAFERLTVVVGKSRKDYAAFWRLGFASDEEIRRLKANIEDPRLSGLDAVHGVPQGPPSAAAPMSVRDGVALVARLVAAYLDRPQA